MTCAQLGWLKVRRGLDSQAGLAGKVGYEGHMLAVLEARDAFVDDALQRQSIKRPMTIDPLE